MEKQLTVKELIAILQTQREDKLILSEGCDCWGEVDGIEEIGKDMVLLTRIETN